MPESCRPPSCSCSNRLVAATADLRYAGKVALLAGIHLAALGLLIWFETERTAQAAFVLTWGLLNCFWLALLRRPLTSAALVACDRRAPDPAVAVQARRAHDDGHLRRPDDHRHRHVLVPTNHHSGPRLEGRPRRPAGDPDPAPAVADRAVPGPAQQRGDRRCRLLGGARRAVVRAADGSGGRVPAAAISSPNSRGRGRWRQST